MIPKTRYVYLGEVRRNPRKVAKRAVASARKGPQPWRRVGVQVSIQRNWDGTYVGYACVKGTGTKRGSGKCADGASGSTPTQAFNKALKALAGK